jgi:hypothetical protein
MKTAAALAGLGFALAGCTTGQQSAALYTPNPALISDYDRLNNGEAILAAEQAECVIGRHAFIGDYIATNRAAALATLAIQAVGAAEQMLQIPAQIPAEGNE